MLATRAGALGGRLDHTFASLSLLFSLDRQRRTETAASSKPTVNEAPDKDGHRQSSPERSRVFPSISASLHAPAHLRICLQIYLLGDGNICFLVGQGESRLILPDSVFSSVCGLVPFGERKKPLVHMRRAFSLKQKGESGLCGACVAKAGARRQCGRRAFAGTCTDSPWKWAASSALAIQ